MSRHRKLSSLRSRMAQEAARLLATEQCSNYQQARRKAAALVGCRDRRQLPENSEIEQALVAYQRPFHSPQLDVRLLQLRQLAVEAMTQLQAFSPRLTGALVRGVVDAHTAVQMQLYAESPEQLQLHLLHTKIPFEQLQRPVHFTRRGREPRPIYRFWAGEAQLELLLLSPADRADPPIDAITGRPEQGIGLARARELLADQRRSIGV